ncbi:hypothetical protein Tco_0246454 [Tanacetum coccineum]
MSQPANDEFSQHLSDDEASNHEDASDTGAAPKQQQQMIPQTTAISNIKLPILKKEEYDIWAMEMDSIYLVYIDNEVWRKGRKDKNILLMAIPKEHMRRFHGMDDAKEIWEAIRTRFQQLLSQLEAHSAEVSTEDANHKFLRSLPPAWSNLAMQMRTNPEIDPPLYILMIVINNLRVFEQEIQGASKTSSSAQNVAFVSQSKSSTNKVKSGFTDLEQIDDVDIEEMDINWQIAMIVIRMKKFYKKTGRRVRVDGKTPQRGHMMERRRETHFINIKKLRSKRRNQMGLLTMDDGIVNWGEHIEAEETNHALMAISSSNEENRMKAVKEKGTIAGTLEFMEDSSKDLWRLIDSGMSSNSEVGLGFEIPIKQLRYALTTNPTIYDSLVKQFWQTATAKTLADGTLELQATIDTIKYTSTEASIRSQLKLADALGITMLPNNEIFEGTGLMGVVPPTPPTTQPIPSEATTIPPLPQLAPPTPIAETTTASPSPLPLPAHKPMEHTFEQPPTDQQPPSPNQKLLTPIKTFEVALNEKDQEGSFCLIRGGRNRGSGGRLRFRSSGSLLTKKRYKKGKFKKKMLYGLDFEEVKSSFEEVNTGGIKVTFGIEEINVSSLDVNTGIDLVTTNSIRVSVPSPDRGRREGKAHMIEEEETQTSRKTKEQILQEEAGLAEIYRLDA